MGQQALARVRSGFRRLTKPVAAAVLVAGTIATESTDVKASCVCYYGGAFNVGSNLCMPGGVLKSCVEAPGDFCYWEGIACCSN